MAGAYTIPPKGQRYTADEEAERIRWALRFIARLEGVGQGLGYGIFHGGSLIRDIDVVAIPWREGPGDTGEPWDFICGLIASMNLHLGDRHETLFGHHATTLWAPGRPDHPIDLKVMRRAAPSPPGDT